MVSPLQIKMTKNDLQKSIADAKVTVFRYLKYRPRSEREIVEKLRGKDFSEEIIEQTVSYFRHIGSLNDAQFALGWTRSRLNKPFGIRRIKIELKYKGVNDGLIANAIDDATQDYEEHEIILKLAERRLRKYQHVDKHTARRRLYGYLARRGFNSGAIVKVLNKIEFE